MRRPRLLVLGEVLQPSGYSTVLEALLPFLEEQFEIHVFSRTYQGPPLVGRRTVHPNAVAGDVWGVEQVPALLARLQPDLVWIVYDAVLYLVHRAALAGLPTVLYCPIDGPHPKPETIARLSSLARLVLFTETSRAAVATAVDPAVLPPLGVLPHGLDTTIFRPLGWSEAERRTHRRELLGREDGFVVLNANRNNRRKRPDLTIEGFACFARTRPDAFLCLHMDPRNDLDLPSRVADAGIADRVIWSDRPLPPADLNRLYNACDVGVNTSGGEGWGLVSFEHAATGAPQVVPRHSVLGELWRDAGVFLEPGEAWRAPMALCEYQEVDAGDLSAALARLYDDPAFFQDRALWAFKTATDPRYRWDELGARWAALFAELVANAPGGHGTLNRRADPNPLSVPMMAVPPRITAFG